MGINPVNVPIFTFMIKKVFLLGTCLLAGNSGHCEVPPKNLDIGIYGFYYRAPLTISLAGASVQGLSSQLDMDGQMGLFVFTNLSAGIRYGRTQDYLSVENQLFNTATASYEDYFQLSRRWMVGGYARYYLDLSYVLSVLLHVEGGTGAGVLTYNKENGNGGIEEVNLPRTLNDVAFAAGLSLRPHPDVGLEVSVLRRFRNESYSPAGSMGLLQLEQYQGTEIRIGARIHLDVVHMFDKREKHGLRPVIR